MEVRPGGRARVIPAEVWGVRPSLASLASSCLYQATCLYQAICGRLQVAHNDNPRTAAGTSDPTTRVRESRRVISLERNILTGQQSSNARVRARVRAVRNTDVLRQKRPYQLLL